MASSSVVDALYDAMLDPALRPGVLRSIADRFNAPYAILAVNASNSLPPQITWVGVEPAYQASYAEHFVKGNDPVHIAAGDKFLGQPYTDRMVLPAPDFQRSSFFQEWCRPQHIESLLGAEVRDNNHGITLLGLGRRETFTEAELAYYRTLMPALRRAFQIHLHLLRLELKHAQVRGLLDTVNTPILLTDDRSRLLQANTRAERMLRTADVVRISEGRLALRSGDDTSLLRAIVEAASAGGRGAEIPILAREGTEARVIVVPLRPDHGWTEGEDRCVAIFVTGSADDVEARISALNTLYGLTPTEAVVAVKVGRGDGLPATAKGLGIRITTARTHLQRVFNKTGTSRQSQLAWMLSVLPNQDV
jgi:DNA-binding CsgD family transcriptional regulator